MPVLIPIPRLQRFCNPFDNVVWPIHRPVSRRQIKAAIESKRFRGYDVKLYGCGSRQHAERIAYFVKFGWTEPIGIDVGVPLYGPTVEWFIIGSQLPSIARTRTSLRRSTAA